LTFARDGTVLWQVPLEDVEVRGWPSWGRVGRDLTVKLRVAGQKVRISFVPPARARGGTSGDIVGDVLNVLATDTRGPKSAEGAAAGRGWRAAFEAAGVAKARK
jgi:hypothetical protein